MILAAATICAANKALPSSCPLPPIKDPALDLDPLQIPDNMLSLLTALAVGLVIGLERGWRERDAADGGRVAGLRTFALCGLLGGAFSLGGEWLLAVGGLGLALLAAVAYRESVRVTGSLSITTAVAMLLTYGLGAYAAAGYPIRAVSAAVLVAVLLDMRVTLHNWLRLMEHRELRAALQMLVLSAVVLPLLPDASYGPYGALNPYRLWWAVVLIAGLSLAGHVSIRFLGGQRGALSLGLLGGLASSTAATLALARQVRQQGSLLEAGLAGAMAACSVMFLRIEVVLMSVAPQLGRMLLAPLVVAATACFVVAIVFWRRRQSTEGPTATPLKPFDLSTALGFGVFLGLMAVLSEAAREWLGASGLYVLALVSGVADVDAITISVSRMQAAQSLAAPVAAVAVALAVLSNMVAKIAIAALNGGAAFGARLAVGYALTLLAGGLALAVVM